MDALAYLAERLGHLPTAETHPHVSPANLDEARAVLRREACEGDPLLFALVYLRHHLRGEATAGQISLSEFHRELVAYALSWMTPVVEPRSSRTAFVAPRDGGKSTWLFLILPLWAAAYGHRKFAAAFAHSSTQAEGHLQTFRHELDTNELLRRDFPELCRPARRRAGATRADRVDEMHTAAGFVFAARGIDSANLGIKVNEIRPDLIILDDIEPEEGKYSADQAAKRLGTLLDGILPLNEWAHVVLVGTVTMPGSLVHQLVRTVTERDTEQAEWVAEQNFRCRYFPAIVTDDDGGKRSLWPEKWPLDWLLGIAHTRAFKKNFMNDPAGYDGEYWTGDDFTYGDLDTVTRVLLEIDPAVTTKGTSDWTGLAVVGYSPTGRCVVYDAWQVKLAGGPLRARVLAILEANPRIRAVRIEVNQGGDLWRDVLHDLPVRLLVHTVSEPKEVRFARALDFYQRRPARVLHAKRIHVLEDQQIGFPKATHDDVADAVVGAVLYFLKPAKQARAGMRTASYI